MAILAVYDELAKHVEKEIVAQEILPELWRMCLDQLLNVAQASLYLTARLCCRRSVDVLLQFGKFMKVINDLSKRIEEQHTKMLESIQTMNGKKCSPLQRDVLGLDVQHQPRRWLPRIPSTTSRISYSPLARVRHQHR